MGSAHVEFFRGISNPTGIKVGPSMNAEWVQGLIATLNPNNEPGRIVLIYRMSAKEIDKRLPGLIQAVRSTGSAVLWICDPMHGNTETSTSGPKMHRFENIVIQLEAAFRIHRELGSWLRDVHSAMTSGRIYGMGLMFRVKGNDNYYRFSMDRTNSFRRLVKKVNGTYTTM